MKSKKKLLIFAAALGIAGVIGYRVVKPKQEPDNIVRVSGNLEIVDAEVSFKIAGRVDRRAVDEGEVVRQGQEVAALDSLDLRHEIEARRAELAAAKAFLDKLEAGSREVEIEAAKARAASAKADRERLEDDYRRSETLMRSKVISEQEYTRSKGLYLVALAREREAQEQLNLVLEGPSVEEIDEARARVDQARAALGLAETRLTYATVKAPFTGVVLSRNIEPGEYVAPGTPVVTIGELEKPWLRAYIDETDLGRVKLGQRVEVTTDTFPDKHYEGRITFIASEAEFTPKNVQTEKERVKLVYRIKIELPNPELELKPGMPADARILLEPEKEAYASNQD